LVLVARKQRAAQHAHAMKKLKKTPESRLGVKHDPREVLRQATSAAGMGVRAPAGVMSKIEVSPTLGS
jgi:hypothetical protein